MKVLSEDQYNILNAQRGKFEELEINQSVKGLPRSWLKEMAEIHLDLFKVDPCITCPAIVAAAMARLYKKIKAYEAETNGGKPFKKNRGRGANSTTGG